MPSCGPVSPSWVCSGVLVSESEPPFFSSLAPPQEARAWSSEDAHCGEGHSQFGHRGSLCTQKPDPLDTGRLWAGPQDALRATSYLPGLFSLSDAARVVSVPCVHTACRLRAIPSTPSVPKAGPGGRQAQQAVSLLSLLIFGTLRILMS